MTTNHDNLLQEVLSVLQKSNDPKIVLSILFNIFGTLAQGNNLTLDEAKRHANDFIESFYQLNRN